MSRKTGIRKTVGLLLLLVVVVLILTVSRQFRTDDDESKAGPPPELQQLGVIAFPEPQPIAPFTLTDHTGEEVDLTDLEGQWTLAFLGYTGCLDAECENLFALLAEFTGSAIAGTGTAPRFWYVTVDPEQDGAEVLERYLEPLELDIRGVTGERKQLESFVRSLKGSFASTDDDLSDGEPGIEFSDHLGIIAPDGKLVAIAQPPFDSQRLTDAYRRLVAWYGQ